MAISTSRSGKSDSNFGNPSSRNGNTRHIAYIILVAVVLLWGVNWPIMKVGLDYIPPLAFGAARMGIGAIVLFLILLATGRFAIPARADMRVVLSEALLHMAAPMALMNLALLHVEAGRSAILSFTTTLWITPFAILVLGERVSTMKGIGIVVGMGGIAILFNPLGFDWSSPDVVIGNALLMFAALTWAIAILIARTQKWVRTPLQLTPWQMLLSTAVLIVPSILYEDLGTIDWSPELFLVLAFNGPIASGFCYWGALVVSRELPSITASMGFLGVPVAGVLFSFTFLGEALTPTLILGLVSIIGGIALVNLGETSTPSALRFFKKKERQSVS